MNWLEELFMQPSTVQTVLLLSLVSAFGLALGKVKIGGISLGVTFVFFAGILCGHFGMDYSHEMVTFAQNTGLIVFVYTLGLQVGPGFFSSMKKGGFRLNMLGLAVIFIGFLLMLAIHWIYEYPLPEMMGIFCGAVTNTPMLGAAQQALLQVDPSSAAQASDMASACAATYPMGVIGVIIVIIIMKAVSGKKITMPKLKHDHSKTYIAEFRVNNPGVFHKKIKDIMHTTDMHFVISRVWRNGKVSIPTGDTLLEQDDHLLVMSAQDDVEKICTMIGEKADKDWNKEDIDWNAIDSMLISRRIVITKEKINGMKLGALKLRNLYGINITRVNRAGIDLLASPGLRLQIGDIMTIVGEAPSVENVKKLLGNEERRLNEPNLFAIFIGLALGVILGSIPFWIPGMSLPIKLGIAGGPIIMGILMGAFGTRLHLTTYTTQSANLMLRQFGIVIYLAGLGLDAGGSFFQTVFSTNGLIWIGLGVVLTIVPTVIVGLFAQKVLKTEYEKNIGMLCGSMANPMALTYASSTVDNDDPAVSYASVYPLSMFIRVILGQFVMLAFL